LGKEKANGQGEKMNSEEKKQDAIFGVPPQKKKNNGTHYQQFNFHHSSFVSLCYYLIGKNDPMSIIGCRATIFNYFRARTGRSSPTLGS
jgi:hypothetical protein